MVFIVQSRNEMFFCENLQKIEFLPTVHSVNLPSTFPNKKTKQKNLNSIFNTQNQIFELEQVE